MPYSELSLYYYVFFPLEEMLIDENTKLKNNITAYSTRATRTARAPKVVSATSAT